MSHAGIRPAEEEDFQSIIELGRQVAAEPDAFCFDERVTTVELENMWLPEPEQGVEVFVLEVDGIEGIAGVYVLHPSSAAPRGNHVAHGLYMVAREARGRGIGKALCAHCVSTAKLRGYQGMRINMVVSTNTAALRVCAACGFKSVCTLPKAFHHPQNGLVDTHIMFHDLAEEAEDLRTSQRGPSVVEVHALQYPAPPGGLSLHTGEEVHLRPQLGGGQAMGGAVFEVEPSLPEGLKLDPATGAITGRAVGPLDDTRYSVRAVASAELVLRVEDAVPHVHCDDVSMSIDEGFATMVETVTKIEDLLPEPSKTRAYYGDWMIWMVHRAYLDDPTLDDFNFTNMHMPPPHVEPRIAPKLMQAMKWNTHIEVLSLSNSNVQKAQATELAESLQRNTTLKTLNLECNCLDSISVRELALAIKDNPKCGLEHLRFSHQKQMGQFFGRPTEEAVGQMMHSNELIVKLGFECDDAHWRNIIDRALLRNNDYYRRRQANPNLEELPTAEEKPLGHVLLLEAPQGSPQEVLSKHALLCDYMDQSMKLPTPSQLQSCAKNCGLQLSYTVAAPMIKECRAWMMDGATGKRVIVSDAFGMEIPGILRQWSCIQDKWVVDVWTESEDGRRRCTFRSNKDPSISLSTHWVEWLRDSLRSQRGSRAGA